MERAPLLHSVSMIRSSSLLSFGWAMGTLLYLCVILLQGYLGGKGFFWAARRSKYADMKKVVLWMVAFAGLPVGALFSQSLTGTWQSTLQAGGRELRTVFKISTTDADTLKAVLYSI